MKKLVAVSVLILLIIASCSSGRKALQKGNYYSAVTQAVERLKSSPNNKNATTVLEDGYPLALEWTQEEMDLVMSSNSAFKWERAITLMQQVNRLSELIRSTPAARAIVTEPKTYSTELNIAYERAAEERYQAGIYELNLNSRESAKRAFDHFTIANGFISSYKNVAELLGAAKEAATIRVVMETIPVHTERYRLSSEFFYDQVFEYLNNQFNSQSFVDFYTPFQAERENIVNPDMIVNIEFFDFSVGNLSHSEKEETVRKRVKINSKDTTRVQYRNYEAKLKTFRDEVQSGGNLRVRIVEPSSDKLFMDELIPGSFIWINEYAIFAGDENALDDQQLELTKRKTLPPPASQDLFIEFTKPIYSRLTTTLNRFYRNYN